MIRPLGTVQRTDADGYIISIDTAMPLQPAWQSVVKRFAAVLTQSLGLALHSAYVRGSIAKGSAIKNIADLDGLLLLKRKLTDTEKVNLHEQLKQIKVEFPFVTRIEAPRVLHDWLWRHKDQAWVSFCIATQSRCAAGEDITSQLSRFKPGDPATYAHINNLAREIAVTQTELDKGNASHVGWIMKRLVRSGFELVMTRAQVYTRDLHPCYEYFSRYYPEHENAMYSVLELAVNPNSDIQQITMVLDKVGNFIVAEAAAIGIIKPNQVE